jgi:hypothetical protein
MTCFEKYKMEHHGEDPIVSDMCPNLSGGIDIGEPEYCNCGQDEECARCWDREVPSAEPSSVIKDSGERRKFDTGAVRDIQEGKGRCDLMPIDVIGEFSMDLVIIRIADFMVTGDRGYFNLALAAFLQKRDWDIPTMLLETSKHFEDGARKYGEYNWQKGIPIKCYIDSAVRHYLKWLRGDKDEPHDRAFCWNILCAIWTCEHKPNLNDYKENDYECHPDSSNA